MSEESEDRFRRIFKYYKSKLPPPKLDKVIDVTKGYNVDHVMTKIHAIPGLVDNDHLIDSILWKIYQTANGITIITNLPSHFIMYVYFALSTITKLQKYGLLINNQ